MGTVPTTIRRARLACFAAFAIQGLTFASLITRLPTIKDRFDLSDYDVLVVLGVVAVLSAVGSLAAGHAARRYGSAVVLRVALAVGSVCAASVALVGGLAGLVVAVGSYGVAVGAVDAAMNMQGVAVQDRYGRSIMVGFHAMWSGAAVVGGGYAALTLALDWPLLPSLAVVAAVGLLVNAVLLRDLLRSGDPLAASAPSTAAHRVPWVPVLLIGLPTFAMWYADSATSAWGGIYLVDGLRADESAGPLAFTAYQAVLLLVRLVGDRVVRRVGAAAVVRCSGLLATTALALIVLAPSVPVVIAGFGLLGAGLSMIPPLSFVAAGHLDVDGGTQAVARVNVSNYLGYLLAALTLAVVAEQVDPRAMFVLPLLLSPVIGLMARQFVPRAKPAEAAEVR